MSKRNRRERAATGDLSGWEKLMLTFMGPAQLGEDRAPEGFTPDPAAEICGKCGQPWSEHERVRTSTMTYTTCPTAGG